MAFYGFYFAHFEFKDPVPANSTGFFQDFISSSARYCIFANTFQSSGGFSSGAATSAIMASAARRRASPPPSLQVIAARERRDQQYHLYPFLSFYLLLLRDARRWENLVVLAVIGGHILHSSGWNRVNWTAKNWGCQCTSGVTPGTPGSGIPATSTTPESCLEVIDFVEKRAPYCCLKFIYFERATKIWQNLQILFEITYLVASREVWRFHHDIFMAFSEYMNFTSVFSRAVQMSDRFHVFADTAGSVN